MAHQVYHVLVKLQDSEAQNITPGYQKPRYNLIPLHLAKQSAAAFQKWARTVKFGGGGRALGQYIN